MRRCRLCMVNERKVVPWTTLVAYYAPVRISSGNHAYETIGTPPLCLQLR